MSITTILNTYKRPQYLQEQLTAIKDQTIKSDEIWLWNNNCNFRERIKPSLLTGVKIFDCNTNWGFYGRFGIATLVRTDFVCLFDDDTIPGVNWYKNCLNTFNTNNGIIGGAGLRLLDVKKYRPNSRHGWPTPTDTSTEVDLIGHSWFLPSDYIRMYMFRRRPIWDNCEDMHLSAMCQIYGGIKSYTAPHPQNDITLWSSLKATQYGNDAVASHRQNKKDFYARRDFYVRHLTTNGWKLLTQ